MDEAEKYKQRLEAIAEKRRLQEEQDRAKRELEDEKLRLQQLKRKSLRDQWLMEGALSPAFQDTNCSPLWGSQAQQFEEDRLQMEKQGLTAEGEKHEEQMEDCQMEAVKLAEEGGETTEDQEKMNQPPLLDGTACILTNGIGNVKAQSYDASEQNSQSSGPIEPTESVVRMTLEPKMSQVVPVSALGKIPNVSSNEEEDTLMTRAECVIITDEEDDAPGEFPVQDQQENMQSEDTPQPNLEAGTEGRVALEKMLKTETVPETFNESVGTVGLVAEAQSVTGDGDTEEEKKDEAEDNQLETPASEIVQSTDNTQEGAAVPISSELQPTLPTQAEAEGEVTAVPKEAEMVVKAQDPASASLPELLQEVPMVDSQENHRTEAEPGEQRPLLSQDKALSTQTKSVAASSQVMADTNSPTKSNQGEETSAKHKTCKCCSVM